MPELILASKSKARRRLLRQAGIKFKVMESKIEESRKYKKGGCPGLVMDNALNKALDVSKRLDSGVVIGADTVVLAGKRIIGKPKNKNDAFKTLKILSKKPQWVYTGLAVVDISRNKKLATFDKTKVYMRRLSASEIRNYLKRVSPMDKAGSFDIQGLGGIFIDRIEGCFYNVVGLPLGKLAKILKKIGVDIF